MNPPDLPPSLDKLADFIRERLTRNLTVYPTPFLPPTIQVRPDKINVEALIEALRGNKQ